MSDNPYKQTISRSWPHPFVGCLPLPLLNAVVDEVHNNIQAPRPLILTAALASIAVVLQGLLDVSKPSGQVVPTSLMLLVIAGSGERKSTVDNIFMKPIDEYQIEQYVYYQRLFKAWIVKKDIWESEKKATLRCVTKNAEKGLASDEEELRLLEHEMAKPVRPKEFKLLYEDATSEALFHGLHQNLPTAGLMSSEGDAVLSARAFGDLPKQNAIWSGDTITVDRKSTESFKLEGARLTVSIMVQESALKGYMARRGEQARGTGLLARFLACHPMSTQGSRVINNGTQSWEHRDKYNDRLTELLKQNLGLLLDPVREKKVIKFTPEAGDRWLSIYNVIEAEILPGGWFEGAGDHASKLADNIARVAALFHYFEGFEGDISLETLETAISVCKWYSDEFMRIFMEPPQVESDSYELQFWLNNVASKGRRYVRKNHVRQYGPNRVRDKKRLDSALEFLCRQRVISILDWSNVTLIDLSPHLAPNPYAANCSNFWSI
ncbi:YfjI family protein [Pseudomonas paeninsulae]|uniref:YfjI family protein n=1 Tax=Pseudomonas paeninsulae TaxID=3110772 RepID=UPI002D76D2C2|nr:YfjI family protein [Pseudomonas sp. IT1137]